MSATTTTTTATVADIPLPTPPFHLIPGLPNFRDAGGYPVADPVPTDTDGGAAPPPPPRRMVRRGLLYRASEPSLLTDAGAAHLARDLGIRRVYDLRSQTEIDRDSAAGKRHVREWPGSERVLAPVFAAGDYGPEAMALRFANFAREGTEGFVQVYTHILESGASPTGARPFATILRHLASSPSSSPQQQQQQQQPPDPILVHCTAGKDRTGVLVALVLSLCGVPDDAVAHEYALTDLGLGARRAEFVDHLVRHPPLLGDRAGAERMVRARRAAMLGTLAALRARWGSADGFVTSECGLSPAEVDAIRANLVVEVDADHVPLDWEEHAKLTES